ncbi:hypothetical protein D9M69_640120 [compost metagenome]
MVISVAVADGEIVGTFFCCTMCSQASMLPEFTPPSMAATFSLSTNSLAFWMDLGGEPTSSRGTMTSLRPRTPPAALISSAACLAPDSADTPKSAEPLADMSLL